MPLILLLCFKFANFSIKACHNRGQSYSAPTKFSPIAAVGELAHNRSFNKARPYKLKWITFYMKTASVRRKLKPFGKTNLR